MTGTHQSTDDPISMIAFHSGKTEALYEQNCDCQYSCNHQHQQKDQPNLHRHRRTKPTPSSQLWQTNVNKTCTTVQPRQPRSTLPCLAQAYDAHKPSSQAHLHVCLPDRLLRSFSITVSLQFQVTHNMACISPLQRKGHNTQRILPYLVQKSPPTPHQPTTFIPPECCNSFVESKLLRHQSLLHLFCCILGFIDF